MTDIDYAALRALAENATPGPWFAEGLDDEPAIAHDFDTEGHGPGHGSFIFPDKAADAEFIAAMDPPTVIALLDELERLRAEVETGWEYGAQHSQGTNAHPSRRSAEEAFKFHKAGEERLQMHARGRSALVRRRPAGPWGPVPEQKPEPALACSECRSRGAHKMSCSQREGKGLRISMRASDTTHQEA
ncbi:ead/Ea22-like family protein [Agromyces atrinae]|uniref:ead/Ea22-like family protein n=1 Tax=Agromyces atrinae TaxID=592376 RepID=UPI001F57A9FA|nr:ead/Ea22-like family protein [Agromyces atrinae]MCI2958226.1 ead/Ea22-like family protein [Agromyces atrinae]